MEDVNELIYQAIDQVIQSLVKLENLLLQDNEFFAKNNIDALNQNNDNKLQLLMMMGAQVNQLQNRIPLTQHGTTQTLTQYVSHLDYHHAKRIQGIASKLHDQLTKGYQRLLANNHVVASNLDMMHEVWEKLLKFSRQNIGIYDKPELK